MKPVLIVFGTHHGASRKIAGRIAAGLVRRHIGVEVVDAAHVPAGLELDAHGAVIVVASVHMGRHTPEVITFAQTHRAALERLPSLFVSVSLTAAVAADPLGLPVRRAQAHAELLHLLARFVDETGWRPRRMEPVAGALSYRAYPFVLRQVVRLIAWRAGAPTDTTRDHELTDWKAVDRLVAGFVQALASPRPVAPTPPPVVAARPAHAATWN